MLKALAKKRQGSVNPQIKELNTLMWEYITIREDIIVYVVTHKSEDIMRMFVEDSITACEVNLGIGTVAGSIEEKLHNTQLAIKKLTMVKQIIETYS